MNEESPFHEDPAGTPESAGAAPPVAAESKQETRREVVEFVKLIVCFLVLFFILKIYVVEGFEVQGPSMEPTLQNRERILVFKLPVQLAHLGFGHWFDAPEAGDIVIFNSPEEGGKRYVKRVIASGPNAGPNTVSASQREERRINVHIEDQNLYVNDVLVDEAYLPDGAHFESHERNHWDLDAGDIFVMGDHRDVSKDSRAFGPIPEDALIGRAVLRFWPLSRFGFIE